MSPRTKEQLQELKEVRKDQILMTALELFGSKGYQNTSISDITQKANLSKGSLYNYFESKEELLNEVVVFAFKDTTEVGEEVLNMADLSSDELLKSLVDSYFLMMKEQKELMQLILSLAVQVNALPSVHDTINKVYTTLIDQLEVIFIELGYENPKNEAMLFGAIVDGIGIQYMLNPEDYPLDNMKNLILEKY